MNPRAILAPPLADSVLLSLLQVLAALALAGCASTDPPSCDPFQALSLDLANFGIGAGCLKSSSNPPPPPTPTIRRAPTSVCIAEASDDPCVACGRKECCTTVSACIGTCNALLACHTAGESLATCTAHNGQPDATYQAAVACVENQTS